MRFLAPKMLTGAVISIVCVALAVVAQSPVQVTVDLSLPTTQFHHIWKESVGSGHALLGTRTDYHTSLRRFKQDIGFKRVRMHGIFDDDMSVVLPPYDNGDNRVRYEFYNVDVVYENMLSLGVRPIVELSFMPGWLANCTPWVSNGPPCPYVMHYDGIVSPPSNFSMWNDLVRALASHLVAKFGVNEVRQWHFEVWNELWGMPYDPLYKQLYQASYEGIKAVDAQLKIGGPATMQCQFVGEFVRDFAGKFDFVSTHLYPTDPNCTSPAPGASHANCFADTIKDARAKAPADVPFFVTEYNAGLFNKELLYSSYAAAFVFRNVVLLHDQVDVWSYWTFSDIFEENGMHSTPFEGFNYGMQTVRGIKKPVYRAFELLGAAGSTLYSTNLSNFPPSFRGDASNYSVAAFATDSSLSSQHARGDRKGPHVFLSNFVPPAFDQQLATVFVNISIRGGGLLCPSTALVTTVDADHANPHEAWVTLGRPKYPTPAQLSAIMAASEVMPIAMATSVGPTGDCVVGFVELQPWAAVRVDI